MESETDRLEQIIENMVNGQDSEEKLFFNPKDKTFEAEPSQIEITPEDLRFAGI